MARGIMALGFRSVELNYRVTRNMLKTIVPLVEKGELAVSSVHCAFPAVDDPRFDADSRLLGYADEELRTRAVRLAIDSAEEGAALGAKAVVVHPGVVPMDEAPPPSCGLSGIAFEEELKRLWREDGPESASYRSAFDELSERRRGLASAELARLLRSLESVAEAIVRKRLGIVVGIENRPMAFQMPDFVELGWLLERLAGVPVGMWLDVGHGAILRKMGFFDDVAGATRLADRLVGAHIHDVDGIEDHFAPYTREGLDPYMDLIRRAPIKVIEVGAKNGADEIMAGARRLAARLAGVDLNIQGRPGATGES